MRKKIDFEKINYNGTGKRYPVTIEIALTKKGGEKTFTIDPKTKEKIYTGNTTPTYYEFTASGSIGSRCGGQCLDSIYPHLKNNQLFCEIYDLWKKYHLNGMNVGTQEQSQAIEEWKKQGNRYDYEKVCEYLKSIGLYEVLYTGKSISRMYEKELYRYGSAWIVYDIPTADLERIKALF